MLPYGPSALPAKPRKLPPPDVPADLGLVVEDVQTGWVGAIVTVEKQPAGTLVVLEDRLGKRRSFPTGPGFLLEGKPIRLVRPVVAARKAPTRTASGSVAVHDTKARVALGSRIWVEGKHDAELVEKVWGDDLRIEGVVVEMLDGIDDLASEVRTLGPGPGQRLGVLVDHLVPGSKESRIAAEVRHPHVRILGHPYIDVWQAVRPSVLGIERWPVIPRGVPWKEGICEALGWPVDTPAAWRRILGKVKTYSDLEPSLLGRVEELIDFVTS